MSSSSNEIISAFNNIAYDKINVYSNNIKLDFNSETIEAQGGIDNVFSKIINIVPFSRFKYDIKCKVEFEKFGNKAYFWFNTYIHPN